MASDATSNSQIQEFLLVLHKRRWQILLPAALVLAIGCFFAVVTPKKYAVKTGIELKEMRVETDAELKAAEEAATTREVVNAEKHIRHRGRIETVVRAQERLWPEWVEADERGREEILQQILVDLSVSVQQKKKNTGSTFVDITYKDVDGPRAEAFLTSLCDVWIKDVVSRDLENLRRERDTIEKELDDAEKEFKRLHQLETNLMKEMGIDPIQPSDSRNDRTGDPLFRDRDSLRTRAGELQIELEGREAELEALTHELEGEPALKSTLVPIKGEDFAGPIALLQDEILKARTSQEQYLEAHSKWAVYEAAVRELEERLALVQASVTPDREEYQDLPNPRHDELVALVAAKDTEAEGVRAELHSAQRRIKELDPRANKRTDDYRDLGQIRDAKELAQAHKGETNVRLRNKESTLKILIGVYGQPFEVVQPPRWATAPTEPEPWILVVFSLLAGLALGIGIALLAEYGRNSYRSAGDFARVFDTPVLGAIERIQTRAESRRLQMQRGLVGVSSAVILGGIFWFTWTWSESPEKLPVEVQQAIEGLRALLM